jgi:hypothetical protein
MVCGTRNELTDLQNEFLIESRLCADTVLKLLGRAQRNLGKMVLILIALAAVMAGLYLFLVSN